MVYDKHNVIVEEVTIDGGARRRVSPPISSSSSSQPYSSSSSSSSKNASARAAVQQQHKPRASLGIRIHKGQSLVSLSNMLSKDELDYLVQASLEAAETQKKQKATTTLLHSTDDLDDHNNSTSSSGDRCCIRMPTQAAAVARRHENISLPDADQLHDPLSDEISKFVETRILERVFQFVDEELCSSIPQTLLGLHPALRLLEVFQQHGGALQWSNREPAINVYEAPDGYFGIHKDQQALTILMPLTSATDDDHHENSSSSNDNNINTTTTKDVSGTTTSSTTSRSSTSSSVTFQGGGTAFWSSSCSHQPPRKSLDLPSLVLTPPAGTVLLFGGQVYHSGIAITSGTRIVFVASFSYQRRQRHNQQQQSSSSSNSTWMVSAR